MLCILCILFFILNLYALSLVFMFCVLCLFDVYFYVDHCTCNFFVYVISLLLSTLSCIVFYERCYTNTVFSNHFSSCTYTMDTFPKHITQWALQTHTSAYQLTFGAKCTTTTTPQSILP